MKIFISYLRELNIFRGTEWNKKKMFNLCWWFTQQALAISLSNFHSSHCRQFICLSSFIQGFRYLKNKSVQYVHNNNNYWHKTTSFPWTCSPGWLLLPSRSISLRLTFSHVLHDNRVKTLWASLPISSPILHLQFCVLRFFFVLIVSRVSSFVPLFFLIIIVVVVPSLRWSCCCY